MQDEGDHTNPNDVQDLSENEVVEENVNDEVSINDNVSNNDNAETHEENVNDEASINDDIENEQEVNDEDENELNDANEMLNTEEINNEKEEDTIEKAIELQKEITNPNKEEENLNELFMTGNTQNERSADEDGTPIFEDERSATNANITEAGNNTDVFDEYDPNVANPNIVNESSTMRRYNMRMNRKKVVDNVFNQKHYTFLNFYNHKKHIKQKDEYINSICNAMLKLNGNTNCDYVELYGNVVGLVFTQMSARKGIKMFGEEALTALADEYAQLDSLSVFTPRNVSELTRKERREALRTIDLIKKKRCGKVKGRTVVDGRDQRKYYEKSDTSSPAITFESLIATFVVDALYVFKFFTEL